MWRDLNFKQRVEVANLFKKHGIKNFNQVKELYDSFHHEYADGGDTGSEDKMNLTRIGYDADGYPMFLDAEGNLVDANGNTGTVRLPEVNVSRTDPRNYRSSFNGGQEYLNDVMDFTPYLGDVKQGYEAIDAVRQGNYLQAGVLGAGLVLPNVIEKPLKMAGKGVAKALSSLDLMPEAHYLLSKEAEVSHPFFVRSLNEDSRKGDFVTALAKGDDSVSIPLFTQTGQKPSVGTVTEVMEREGFNPGKTRYNVAYEGIQPIDGPYKTTQSMGNYDYASSDIWNAAQYADVGRPEWGSVKLMDNGYFSDSPQYKYAMERYGIIGDLQDKYHSKWGKFKERNPGSNKKTNYGKMEVNMSQEHLEGDWSLEDKIAYEKAMKELSDFWGSGEKSIHAGGLKQRAIALPNQADRVRITKSGEPHNYKDLGLYSVLQGPKQLGTVNDLTGGTTMNDIGKYLDSVRKKGSTIYPYFSAENLLDPLPGTTYGFKLGRGVWGMKNGGKLK